MFSRYSQLNTLKPLDQLFIDAKCTPNGHHIAFIILMSDVTGTLCAFHIKFF